MKNDPIYVYYLSYIKNKLNNNVISIGAFSLLRISKESFDDFKYTFENNKLFNNKMIELHKCEMRDLKINNIFNDTNRRDT